MKVKRSIFSRIFTVNLVIILVSAIMLAGIQTYLVSRYVYREKENTLRDNAKAIGAFIDSGTGAENLENFLHGFSQSTNSNILIVERTGEILLASTRQHSMNGGVARIDGKVMKDVASKGEHIVRGNLGGVYRVDMFTLQVPIVARNQSEVIGAIFISVPTPEMNRVRRQFLNILLFSLIFVIFISFALSFALSRSISKPIKTIGKTANKFANGDFSSRVELNDRGREIAEISEVTQAFNDMAFSLQKSDEIRSNFMSDVAHELRTPMTTISGFMDGMLDGTIPPEKHKDYMAIVRDEVVRLSSLVTSFLELTRIQKGDRTINTTNFDINETIRRTLVGFEKNITEKGIRVDVKFDKDSTQVKGDMNAIRQVMTNLIENAIKFTEKGGTLRVSVTEHRREAQISVYNTGCGISADDQKMIFERFYKADKSRSLNPRGTGIGLYIVKDILSRHGKQITVQSVEGEYAEFTFSLDKA